MPRQPWLHELELAVHGNVTALSARSGDMGAPGTGLYVDDRRVLSHLSLQADHRAADLVVSASVGDRTEVLASLRHLGAPGPDPTVEVLRRRRVSRGGMRETITLTSRAPEPVRTRLELSLAGDGAPLARVKDGMADAPLLPAMPAASGVTDVALSWSDDRHVTAVTCTPAPDEVHAGSGEEPSRLVVTLEVPPGRSRTVTLEVAARRLGSSAFDAEPGADLLGWTDVRVTAADGRLGDVVQAALEDLRQLAMTDPLAPEDVFAGAGSPWYLTLFGRDSLWAARLVLPFGTRLAAGTLRTLARRQGRREDQGTAEQPGRILHEVRREVVRDPVSGRSSPTIYYGTVDATALWVCLLHDAWRHGMPAAEVAGLAPELAAATGWLTRMLEQDPDGLLRYVDREGAGLANQGWKDSGDSMRRADGTVADAPIALVEAQAYTVEALRKAAALADALDLGEAGPPGRLRDTADQLAEQVRRHFWVTGAHGRHLALALDGHGHPVDGVGSNMGHVLATGCLDGEESERVARVLTSPDLLGRYGVATLSRSNPAYNPIGYHTGSVWTHDTAICLLGLVRDGHHAQAVPLARALVESAVAFGLRWPELCSGDPVLGRAAPYPAACRPQAWSAASAGALVTAVLGLEVDVPGRRVRLRPLPGAPFGELRVEGLRYGASPFAVSVDARGEVQVEGLPETVTVEVG